MNTTPPALHGTISIETEDGIVPLLSQGSQLPLETVRRFSTAIDNQTQVGVTLVFGENLYANENLKLGTFIFRGIPPGPRAAAQIDIQVQVDAYHLLRVYAIGVVTGHRELLGQVDLARLEPPPRRAGSKAVNEQADIQVPLQLTLDEAVLGTTKKLFHPETRKQLEVKIPPGVNTGTQIRLRGQGQSRTGSQQPGNMYVVIDVTEHPLFTRIENDLILHLPVEARFADNGGEIRVPKLQMGQFTLFYLPPGTKNSASFRIPKGGVQILTKTPTENLYGDLVLKIETYHRFWKSPRIRKRLNLIRQALGDGEIELRW